MKKQKPQKNKPPAKHVPAPSAGKQDMWLIAVCLLMVVVAYLPVLSAGFVNWDDDDYVVKNTLIRSLSNAGELFTSPVQGNYHPLTMLSLALNYSVSELKPFSYHLVNLIIHLLNTFLVFRLASKLSRNNNFISFATALLFGIHPLHVESVAWISERKDVLYGFFFLLGLISYINYIQKKLNKDLLLTFCWFTLSILSKPAAIIFPVVLFLFDFFFRRKIAMKIFLEKIPFFAVSLFFAYLTLKAQKTVGATDNAAVFSAGNRMLFAFYGYAMYFFKTILPVNLVAFYPTPPINEPLPSYFFIMPLFFIATVVTCLITWKRDRLLTFGFGFYFANLLLVLQFVVVGSALMADRYAYIPLIGLFFMAGCYLFRAFERKLTTAYTIIIVVGVILIPVTYNQAGTWKNGETLWENAIQKHPGAKAYVMRAEDLKKKGNLDKALDYYNHAISLNKADPEAFGNRGNIYFERSQDSLALADYEKALALKPDFVTILSNKGSLLSRQGKPEEGLKLLQKALELDSTHAPAYRNMATTYLNMKEYEKAIAFFKKYIALEPGEAEIYNAIGVCYQNLGTFEPSLKYFSDAISHEPNGLYFLNRSYSYNALGKPEDARNDAVQAREKGMTIDPAYAKMIGL